MTFIHFGRARLGRLLPSIALCLLALSTGLQAQAQAQNSPIRVLVGFPPGGSTDIIARHLALGLQTELGRTVVVDNRPGAGGQIAALALKAARPDGTTLFLSNSHTTSIVPLTMLSPGFDPVKDFAPVGLVATNPDVFAVNPAVIGNPNAGLREFAQWAKANPGKGNVGVPAPGSAPEFAVTYITRALQSDLTAVQYRGDAPIVLDLVGGQIAGGIGGIGAMLPQAKAGKLRIVAVNGSSRMPLFPDVPTYGELGIKGLEEMIFTALFAPSGTAPELVAQYNAALVKVVNSADFAEKISSLAVTPKSSTPQELAKRMQDSRQAYIPMLKAVDYKPQ